MTALHSRVDSDPGYAAGPGNEAPVTWTPEQIQALGATTDLPTLGSIFGASRWKTYEMARTGEWHAMGIKIVRLGSRYRVIVRSVLDVLGYSRIDDINGEPPEPGTAPPALDR